MIYLKDTCVLIKKFDTSEIIRVAGIYKDTNDTFGLTDIIMDELRPGKSVNQCDAEKSKSLLACIKVLENSHLLETYLVKDNGKYKDNFDKIRRAFYGHLKDLNFVRQALAKGEITKEQFKNRTYIYKDYGECSCIAVAMENPTEIAIVSNDKGRIFLKPAINLFDKYRESDNIQVFDYEEWEKKIESDINSEKKA